MNPTVDPAMSQLFNGKWALLYAATLQRSGQSIGGDGALQAFLDTSYDSVRKVPLSLLSRAFYTPLREEHLSLAVVLAFLSILPIPPHPPERVCTLHRLQFLVHSCVISPTRPALTHRAVSTGVGWCRWRGFQELPNCGP